MFDASNSSKEQGNVAVSAAIYYYSRIKATVSIPLNDSQDYDLIVDISNKLYKVQVKSTRCRSPSGTFRVDLRNTGGTSGKVSSRVKDGSSDYLFILTQDGVCYFIPKEVYAELGTSITLGEKYKDYKIE